MAVFDDVEGPFIYEVDILPVAPAVGDTINVVIYAFDASGVSGVKLSYSVDGEEWQIKDMNFYTCLCISGGRWVANFGPIEEGQSAQFFVTMFDNSPTINSAESDIYTIQIES